MFDKFWEKLGEELAGRWASQTLGPMLAFWAGGLLAWIWRTNQDWQQIEDHLAAIDAPAAYVAIAVGGLFILAASSALVSALQRPTLRLLEGYWPWPFRGLRFAVARWRERRLQEKEDRWQELAALSPHERTARQQSEYARLDAEIAHHPVDPQRLMPTTLGNLLRSAEEYPLVRYGLSMSTCWPRLWLVIPKETQETVAQARQKLNQGVQFFTWAVLFAAWVAYAWWAVAVSLVAAGLAYCLALQAAGAYSDLLRAAFDVHRFQLYEQVRWPLPPAPAGEEVHGDVLSQYLFRGTVQGGIAFTHPEEEGEE